MARQDTKNQIPDWITEVLKKRIEEEAKILLTEAKKRLEQRVPEITAGIIVDVMSMAEMRTMEDRFVFEIRKKV